MPNYSITDPLGEFYLFEAGRQAGNDTTSTYPADAALQIWHFDAGPRLVGWPGYGFRFNNWYTSHKFARVMEADGREDIENLRGADAGDLYQPGQTLGPSTTPSSTPYYGARSGVTISDISRVPEGLSLTAGIGPYDYDFAPPISSSTAPDEWTNQLANVTVSAIDVSPYVSLLAVPEWGFVSKDFNGLSISGEGTTAVEFRSVDFAGNAEETRTAYVRVDKTKPTVTCETQGSYAQFAPIVIRATDSLSGIDAVYSRLDSGYEAVGSTVVVQSAGPHTLEYWATDAAGNASAHTTRSFVVNHRTATSLTTKFSTIGYAVRTAMGGSVSDDGVGVSGLTVRSQHSADNRTWKDTGSTAVTQSGGGFTLYAAPGSRTYYRVRTAAGTGYLGSVSGPIVLMPRVRMTRSTSWSTLSRRRTYHAKGYIEPKHHSSRSKVRIRAYKRGKDGDYRYVKSFVASYSRHSTTKTRYEAAVKLESKGQWKLVAYHPQDSNNAETYGTPDYVRVK